MSNGGLYERFSPRSLARLERRIRDGDYVSDLALAEALRANAGDPLPNLVLDYLCRRLEGKVRKPRGRKAGGPVFMLRNAYAAALYERYLTWLQRRERSLGLKGWGSIREADWWQGPPHERAARMKLPLRSRDRRRLESSKLTPADRKR